MGSAVMGKKKKVNWFDPKTHSGWSKNMPAGERRKLVLEAHDYDYLAAARSKQALANVTADKATKKVALADAKYFYRIYNSEKKGK